MKEPPCMTTRFRAVVCSWMVVIAVVGLFTPFVITGCREVPKAPQAVTFVSMKDTWSGVKAAMRVYADAAARGKVSIEKQEQIDSAYEKFRVSFLAAIKTARFDWSASTPAEQDALAQTVINLINQLNL